jgi:hypothetical protein
VALNLNFYESDNHITAYFAHDEPFGTNKAGNQSIDQNHLWQYYRHFIQ